LKEKHSSTKVELWNKLYTWLIPFFVVIILMILNHLSDFSMVLICEDDNFADMLSAIITSMSIIISIFGFLMPSLVSVKNEKMVKYFIENADMDDFVAKIKSVIRSGMIGILLSIVLYVNAYLILPVRTFLLYAWIGINANFVCCSYRFIGIIISLLLKEKKDIRDMNCPNEMTKEEANTLNSKLRKI